MFKKVVIAVADPNKKAMGGIEELKKAVEEVKAKNEALRAQNEKLKLMAEKVIEERVIAYDKDIRNYIAFLTTNF